MRKFVGDARPSRDEFPVRIPAGSEPRVRQLDRALQRARERERQAEEELARLAAMKGSFLEAISHELRTPLSAVLGLALTLERSSGSLTEQQRAEIVHRIARSAGKLAHLLSDLLDLDRLSRGVLETQPRETDLASLIREAVEAVAGDRAVEIDVDGARPRIDPAKTGRIVENLIANAVRHTPEHARVWVRAFADDRDLVLQVEDDGPGIPEEDRDAIFEPFSRAGDHPHSPGTGIGLAVVSRLAELHGGGARFRPRRGGGSIFEVKLAQPARSRTAG